jgi:enoyl-[acyl-carrier protein] reductase III
MKLPAETVLITGGTRGLGLATAQAFAKTGRRLLLTYRSDRENADRVKRAFGDQGVECHLFEFDLSEAGSSERLRDSVQKHASDLSVYVHNAAATAFKPLLDLKPHHIQRTLQLTVSGFIENMQWVAPMMANGGAVVTVSGVDTKEAVPFHGLLGAAKSALETLTSYFAHELAEKKIRVNGVNPGYLDTDSIRKYLGPLYAETASRITTFNPLREKPRLEDVAAVIEFLASESARWIVGQTLVVDGGQKFTSPVSFFLQRPSPSV